MFLQAIEILLQNVRTEREGNWSLHLNSTAAMLPYIYITNRINYSRWLPVYPLDMLSLPLDVELAFQRGEFSIRQKPGKFNGVWSDMATEKSVIKHSKGCDGISGITRQKPTLMRWSLTRHVLADFTSEMKTRSGCSNDKSVENDEVKPIALIRDEDQVQKIVDHVLEKMTDPFATELNPPSLINSSTGMHASKDIQTSLTSAVDDGNTMARSFIDEAFAEGKTRSFFGSTPRSKLKTFEDLTKTTKLKCRKGEILNLHINPELVFRRALVLANSRDDVNVEKVLSFPIGPIPTALFHDYGTMTNHVNPIFAINSKTRHRIVTLSPSSINRIPF
ncbi:unnamed protein product [Mytilus coruscus]|uniref:Uncharacterized protein n=1 Tax=Mytilus coruscus TaxID=42192 RepID=A0A6J8BBQ9_MYTCO|nr:unnamed protein product [Mytilus coruscus]